MTPFKPITAWSYSRYSLYAQCPLKFKLSVIDKIPEPKGAALIRGADIHTQAEQYLKGKTRTVPPIMKAFADDAKRLRAKRKRDPSSVIIEDNWAYRSDWTMTRWDDWTECRLRIKVDVAERDGSDVLITDYKSGKFRPDNREDYMQQLQLYGVGALTVFQHITDINVTTRLVYLDAGIEYPTPADRVVYTAKDRVPMQKAWDKRVAPMFKDKTFAPRPNQWCGWCHYRKANGGPCPY